MLKSMLVHKLGRRAMMGAVTTLVLAGIGLAVLGAGGIAAWEFSNSDTFCTVMCHSVHPEEPRAHKASLHARVNCVECHMGRLSTLHLMALKPTHAKELWGMIAGYERPLTSSTLRPSRDHCESCHWPSAVHDDSIVVKKRYATDEASSETAIRLTLHTGFGAVREKQAKGIHWHVENEVQFIALDQQRRDIPWVQVKTADGKTVTYVDATSKISPEELKKHTPRRMECFDCHNAVGHPFTNPADLVDEALASGKIDRSLPFAKARSEQLIEAAAKIGGSEVEVAARIDKLLAESAAKAAVAPENKEKEQKFQAAMKAILVQTAFSRPELNWQSFPNHAGHKDFPGCFRCHNGKHLNEQGEAIRLQCTLCHDLPQVKREDGKGSVASTIVPDAKPPRSHNAPNFMREHRFKLDPSCSACHGKLEFGREGGNFCSNPACHGRKWPEVTLSVKKPG